MDKATRTRIREDHIMNALRSRGHMTVEEAVRELQISESTIRRLFAQMAEEKKLIRTFGGVRLAGGEDPYSFTYSEKINENAKQRIGFKAASLVESGQSIYLDCGTTVLKMAEALFARIEAGELTSLNIVTNSLANLQALSPASNCHVILLGGEYQYMRRDFSGTVTENCLQMFHFTRCFLGCDGASASSGFTSGRLALSSLNRSVIRSSDSAAILADREKFGRTALISFASLSDVSLLITDADEQETEQNRIRGMQIIRV